MKAILIGVLVVCVVLLSGCEEKGVVFENVIIDEIPNSAGNHTASVILHNQAEIPAKCFIFLNIGGNVSEFDVGIIDGSSRKNVSFEFDMPYGNSSLKFEKNCSFSSN